MEKTISKNKSLRFMSYVGIFLIISLSLNFSMYSKAFAILEFPTDINQRSINSQSTYSEPNFFQSILQRINFGGMYNKVAQPVQNTKNIIDQNSQIKVESSSYDAEYQNILNQNLGITKDNIKNISKKSTNTLEIGNSNNAEIKKFLTKNEIELRLSEFVSQINNKRALATSTFIAPNQKEQQEYYNSFGKSYNQEDQNQKQQSYFTPNDRKYYEQFPEIKNYNDNPSTRYSNSALSINADGNRSLVTMNEANFRSPQGNSGELDGRLFKILPGGWLETNASNFGLNTNGAPDKVILPKYGCLTAMSSLSASGPINVCNKSTCVVSFPREVINYYYGKVDWKNPRSIYTRYKEIAGNRVEIYNYQNGKCAVAPLWELGPGNGESQRNRFGIDLTYCVKVSMLGTTSGAPKVKYRPVPAGKTGCDDYTENRSIAPVMFLKK